MGHLEKVGDLPKLRQNSNIGGQIGNTNSFQPDFRIVSRTMLEQAVYRQGPLALRFWGARGSYPVPGPATIRYGGNTPCVEFRLGQTLFIVDAGSGIEALGRTLRANPPAEVNILLSHLHHDHVSGLPFFAPALNPNCLIRIFCGNLGGASAQAALDQMFSPPLFPMRLADLPAKFEFVGFNAGETLHFDDCISVKTCPLDHPGGATGYAFEHGGRRVCYVSDMEHQADGPAPRLVKFCADADLLIYDSMFTDQQYRACKGWGHSTWREGVKLCRAANARNLAAFHHNTIHDDDRLDLIGAQLGEAQPGSFVAREGVELVLANHAEMTRSLAS